MKSIKTCLMFVGEQYGNAEAAINLYTSVFENSRLVNIERYGGDNAEIKGGVKMAVFTIKDVEHMAMDSGQDHKFEFTPAISIFVECSSEEELKSVHDKLIQNGDALMPLDDYGFSQQYGWVKDKYGVTWQLNLS